MNNQINIRVTQEQIAKERRRRMAVTQSGHSFFVLELSDFTKSRVSAVDELLAKPSVENPGKYVFEIVSRQLQFEPDLDTGLMVAHVLDTEWNRKFLASHLDPGYWEIVSVISGRKGRVLEINSALKELCELRDKLMAETIEANTGHGKVPALTPPNRGFDIGELPDDVIENEIKRREAAKKVDIGVHKKKNTTEFVVDINISPEDFAKLTPQQKTKVTKARNLEAKNQKDKPAIVVSSKQDDIVVSSKEGLAPSSPFLKTPGGMVQP